MKTIVLALVFILGISVSDAIAWCGMHLSPDTLLIYPNPATSEVYIQIDSLDLAAEWRVKVVDVSGNVLMNVQFDAEHASAFRLNTSSLLPGSYIILLVSSRAEFYSGKLIIQRE